MYWHLGDLPTLTPTPYELLGGHRYPLGRRGAQMYRHLGDFPRKLGEHCHAVYEYVACPPVAYPELADELWCHRYYLRNLCAERFADWPIVDHVPLLQARARPARPPARLRRAAPAAHRGPGADPHPWGARPRHRTGCSAVGGSRGRGLGRHGLRQHAPRVGAKAAASGRPRAQSGGRRKAARGRRRTEARSRAGAAGRVARGGRAQAAGDVRGGRVRRAGAGARRRRRARERGGAARRVPAPGAPLAP